MEGLLANGSSECEAKPSEVEGLAKLLGVQQMKVTGQDSSTVIPATILPAAMFREASFPFLLIQLILKKTHFLSWGLLGNILYRVFFFTGPPLKKTKSKIVLEYPDWASPGPHKKVKVHGLGLP